ncbi:CdaR family transcriptional regulator [Bacillus weihaiensis]|uniref:Transcriptional regulator n=1 Tax=Bacillus weihaiensis TaxID=1547283 RepID=A0A1L3MTX3_9BACI|nr:sugar diacid recognition domain-containing protein [Bacillus weihaiensis]APH05798.1 hypothetical protein A9C19_14240 [Bacillus weihaiensis]
MLTKEIAQTIVNETSNKLNRNINIMNDTGIIIASTDPKRISDIHEGAQEVVKTRQPLTISADNKHGWRGSHQGINLPIEFQEEIVGVIGITGNPEEVKDFAGIVKMITELMIKQKFIANQLEWQQRTKEMIIEELLKEAPSYKNVDRGLHLLETTLNGPFTIHVVQLFDRSISNQTILQLTERMIGDGHGFSCFININRLFFVFSGISEAEVDKKRMLIYKELKKKKLAFKLAFSTPFTLLEDFKHSYTSCELALKISSADEDFISFADIEAEALIHLIDPAWTQKFSDRVMNKSVKKYSHTLGTFFNKNLNIQHTADELFIHRNTLIYRLTKIHEETGYDPKNFKDALTLQLALWCSK